MTLQPIATTKEYKKWLETELALAGISNTYLQSVADLAARAIIKECADQGWPKSKAYFKVFKRDGTPSRAWWYVAELVLWLEYKQYPVMHYVRSLCHLPQVAGLLRHGKPVSLSTLAPSTRHSTARLKAYAAHYERWKEQNGSK